ncbi:MAG: hypothetical protein M1548_04550 [Actinobacteria bacterium]|nr:hypothetical protein [Actinomycetota bacterium]
MLDKLFERLEAIEEGKGHYTIVMVTVRVSPKILIEALRRDLVAHLVDIFQMESVDIEPIGEDCLAIVLPDMPGHRSITVVRKIEEEIARFEKTLPHHMRIVHEMLVTPKDVKRIKEILSSSS